MPNNASSLDSLSIAAKAEVLLGRTELALSTWGKEGKKPVIGLDGTSRLLDFQIAGEASLRNGLDIPSLDSSLANITTLGDRWFPRVSLGLTKFLPLAGVADRVTLVGEFYYNGAGADTNIFNNSTVARLLHSTLSGAITMDTTGLGAMPWLKNPSSISDLYTANSYSKYYAAFFGSISQFIRDDMTFTFNAIANLEQKCCIVSAGVGYQSLHDFVCGVSVNAFLGPPNTEYTFAQEGLMVQGRMGIIFWTRG